MWILDLHGLCVFLGIDSVPLNCYFGTIRLDVTSVATATKVFIMLKSYEIRISYWWDRCIDNLSSPVDAMHF